VKSVSPRVFCRKGRAGSSLQPGCTSPPYHVTGDIVSKTLEGHETAHFICHLPQLVTRHVSRRSRHAMHGRRCAFAAAAVLQASHEPPPRLRKSAMPLAARGAAALMS